jgi:hypothetical protein
MMDKTTWMTADEALENGFIDEVSEDDAEAGLYEIENLKNRLPENIYNSVSEWNKSNLRIAAQHCNGQSNSQASNSKEREMKNLLKLLVENKMIQSIEADESDAVIALKNFIHTKDQEIKNLKEQNDKLKNDSLEMAKAAAQVAVNTFVECGVIEADESEFWVENYLNDKDRTVNVLEKRRPKSRAAEPLNLGNQTAPEPSGELEKLRNAYNKETDTWKRGELARRINKLENENK